jgi:hypothetical protein
MLDPTSLPLPATGPATAGSRASERDVGADGFASLLALLAVAPPAGSAAEPTSERPEAMATPAVQAGGIDAARRFAAGPLATAPPDPTLAPTAPLPTVAAPAALVDANESAVSARSGRAGPPPACVPHPNVPSASLVDPSGVVPEGPGGFGGSTAASVRAARPSSGTGLSGSIRHPRDAAVEAAGAGAGDPNAAFDRMASDGTGHRQVGTPSPATGREPPDAVAVGPVADVARAEAAPVAGETGAASVPRPAGGHGEPPSVEGTARAVPGSATDGLAAPLTPLHSTARSTETASVQVAPGANGTEVASVPRPAAGRGEPPSVEGTAPTVRDSAADRLATALTPLQPTARSTETAPVPTTSVAGGTEVASAPRPAVEGSPPAVGGPSQRGPVDRSAAPGAVADPATGRTGEGLDTTGSPDAPPTHAAALADPPASAGPASGQPGADPALLPRATAAATPQPPSVQIASAVLQRDGAPIDRLRVALEPAELGSVEVTLTSERRGRTRALVLVDRPETLELLQREQRTLERILLASGLELEAGGLELGLRREGDRGGGSFAPPAGGVPPSEPARLASSPGPTRLLELRVLDLFV